MDSRKKRTAIPDIITTKNDVEVEKVKSSVSNFYNEYFSKNTKYFGCLKEYKEAASSRTRSASQKNNRMNALLKYCSLNMSEKI